MTNRNTGLVSLKTMAILASTTALSLVLASPAFAQTAQAAGDHVTQLDDIVVTATRQETKLSKVPISASAFTQSALDKQGVKQIDDIARITPGVTFTRGNSGSTEISIRGIASDSGASTTGVYIDDTPVQSRVIGFSSTTVFPNVFDLQRVEILRGPQGTLFGAGSEGGTVRFITPQPSLTSYTDYVRSEVAFTDHGQPSFEAGGAVGGPLVEDKIGFRASAWYRHDGGYTNRVDRFDGSMIAKDDDWQNSYNARLAMTFQPTPGLLITPSFYYQHLYINDSQTYWEYLSNPSKGQFNNGAPVVAPFQGDTYLPALNMTYEGSFFTIHSNTSYFVQKNENNRDLSELIPNDIGISLSPTHPVPGYPDYRSQDLFLTEQKAFTQEVRIQSKNPDSRLTWVVGGFYQHEDQSSQQFVPDTEENFGRLVAATFNGASITDVFGSDLAEGKFLYRSLINSTDEQVAGFGEATLKVIGGLSVTGGVRVSKSTFSFVNRTDGPFNGGATTVTGAESESPITPKFSASYQIDSNNMIYATAAKGFRSGGANPAIPTRCNSDLTALGYTNGAPTSYDSDSVWSYELGSKNTLAGGRIRLDSSIFDVKWNGIQEAIILPSCGLDFVANLGKATSKGFDIQAQFLLSEGLTAGIAVGYTKATFDESILSVANPITGIQPVLVRKGNTLGVNPWTVSLNLQYDFPAWGHKNYVRVNDDFRSKQTTPTASEDPGNETYSPGLIMMPQTNQLSVRFGTIISNGVDISVFANNVFDSHPALARVQTGSNLDSIYADRTFRPRTVGVTVSGSF